MEPLPRSENRVRIADIIWLDAVVEKLQVKHHVEPEEVQEVFAGQPYCCFTEKGHRKGEDVYTAFGRTHAGRYLVIYFVAKEDRSALIISARDMSAADRRRYERR